jgi:hypothetical protein
MDGLGSTIFHGKRSKLREKYGDNSEKRLSIAHFDSLTATALEQPKKP